MTDTVQCWLVERTFDDRNLVTIVYATPDGERYLQQERSANSLTRNPVTAGKDVPAENLEATEDEATRERYEKEATRTAEQYDEDEAI
ncbi:hypothetical protein [Haloarchaeobius sp. HME9146]|uniref:hypothetical protein n=1 Tax=Haloarchaeobius sp. HME9146 TaxID=2978732 RepID=UPI0021BE579E|nr:hypothetical protein [Haloarchaeobius sp. HME9146]MCT9094897.1 hypothetical protein [Haloarchaeobius sp. HME9146]